MAVIRGIQRVQCNIRYVTIRKSSDVLTLRHERSPALCPPTPVFYSLNELPQKHNSRTSLFLTGGLRWLYGSVGDVGPGKRTAATALFMASASRATARRGRRGTASASSTRPGPPTSHLAPGMGGHPA